MLKPEREGLLFPMAICGMGSEEYIEATSGKTEFSFGFQKYPECIGYAVRLIHLDDFHNPSAVRIKDRSPEGYINNAFDLIKLSELLEEIRNRPIGRQIDLLHLDMLNDIPRRRRYI